MSARAAFRIRNKKNTFLTFATKDGEPHLMPMVVADFIEKGHWVKGVDVFARNNDIPQFNGIGCFAASLIAHIKTSPGGVYIIPHSEWGNGEEEFLYDIIIEGNEVTWEAHRETFSSIRGEKYYLLCSCCNSDFLGLNFIIY
jgi:hypothetical protein